MVETRTVDEPIEGAPPERMSKAKDGWEVDQAIEAGLLCPSCGSRCLRTLQQGTWEQDADNGEWTTCGTRHECSETIEVRCRDCDSLIWEKR
jgi:DNA-directed RNA polymerase subunit RPC12/RpoP